MQNVEMLYACSFLILLLVLHFPFEEVFPFSGVSILGFGSLENMEQFIINFLLKILTAHLQTEHIWKWVLAINVNLKMDTANLSTNMEMGMGN